MPQDPKDKIYNLEDRSLEFAKQVRIFISKIPKTLINMDDCKQLIRSSGSIGANYIEANESLSKKDFLMRIKICKKESKETIYWLNLLNNNQTSDTSHKIKALISEATELMKIFGAIIVKSK